MGTCDCLECWGIYCQATAKTAPLLTADQRPFRRAHRRHRIFHLIVQRLILNGLMLFGLFFCLDLLLGFFDGVAQTPSLVIKSAKIASLIAMNIHGDREVNEIIVESGSKFDLHLRRYILRTYRRVRGYIWLAVLYIALVTYLPLLGSGNLTQAPEFTRMPEFEVWLPNALALFPVFFYMWTTFHCLREIDEAQGKTSPMLNCKGPLRRHLATILYFVDIPLAAAIIAFFFLAKYLIQWAPSTKAQPTPADLELFVDGAAALLVFLSHAMVVCADKYAEFEYYHRKPRGLDADYKDNYLAFSRWLLLAAVIASLGLSGYVASQWTYPLAFGIAGAAIVVHSAWAERWIWLYPNAVLGLLYFGYAATQLPVDHKNVWLPHWHAEVRWCLALGLTALLVSAVLRLFASHGLWRNGMRYFYASAPLSVFGAGCLWGFFSVRLSPEFLLSLMTAALTIDLYGQVIWIRKVSSRDEFANSFEYARKLRRFIRDATVWFTALRLF